MIQPQFSVDQACLSLEEGGFQARLESFEGSAVIYSGAHGLEFQILFVAVDDDEPGFGMFGYQCTLDLEQGLLSYHEANDFNAKSTIAKLFIEDSGAKLEARIPVPESAVSDLAFVRVTAAWMMDLRNLANLLSK